MTKNQGDKVTPEIKCLPNITDACSCTTCESLGCFAFRQIKCCANGTCPKKNSKTHIFYESKKKNLNECQSNSSDLIGCFKQIASSDVVDNRVNVPTMEKLKYYDVESKSNDKMGKIRKKKLEDERIDMIETMEAVKDMDIDTPGAKLSAQIMNLSYKDFKQSLSYNRSDTSTFKISKLSKYDILFQKIKEVYKACSCKVCECLIGKSTRNDSCRCKPCECTDCLSCVGTLPPSLPNRIVNDCCGYKQYQKMLAGIDNTLNGNKLCSCKPCDCLECADIYISPCNCEACQCVDCRSISGRRRAPVIVAPVVDDSQRNVCQCNPCECIECGRRYGLSSNLMHEMSTGTHRQRHPQCHCELCQNESCVPDGTGSCKCDRSSRVVHKPVERDAHDYDIRPVLFDSPINKPKRHDTIAMFATVSNTYPRASAENTKQCTCEDCECLVCSYKENAINAIKSSQLFTPPKLHVDKSKLNARDTCKCQPCECDICHRYKGTEPNSEKKCLCDICDCASCRKRKATPSTKRGSNDQCKCEPCECDICQRYKGSQPDKTKRCLCAVCDCVSCTRRKKAATIKQASNDSCKCKPCECNDCDRMNFKRKKQRSYDTCVICKKCLQDENISNVQGHTSKSGEKLFVSTSQNTGLCSRSCRDSQLKIKSQPESLSIYRAFPTLDFPQQTAVPKTTARSQGTIRQANLTDLKPRKLKCPKRCNVLKCDAYTQQRNRNRDPLNNPVEYKASVSYFSDSSISIKSNSKTSFYYKDNGSVTPVSGHKNKSCESSCNSSGYDCPDYLVQFPKSTVETCLKDVMKLNLDKNIKLDRLKMTPQSRGTKRYVNSASWENTPGKLRLSQGYDDRRHKRQYKPLDIKRSSHRTLRRKTRESYEPTRNGYSKKITSYSQKIDSKNKQPSCSPDVTVLIKNKSSQTERPGNTHITESTSSIRVDIYGRGIGGRKTFPRGRNSKDFKVSRNVYDYHVMNEGIPNLIQSDQLQWKCSHTSPFLNFTNSTEFFKIDEDYKRIQKTLLEAKAFSSDLMKILEKYEKDNREFVSISQKLKLSHQSIFNNTLIKNNDICNAEIPHLSGTNHKCRVSNAIEHELLQIHLENPSTEEKTSLQVIPKRAKQEKTGESGSIFQNINANNRYIMVIVPNEHSNEAVKSLQNNSSIITGKMVPKDIITMNQSFINAAKDAVIHKCRKSRSYKRAFRKYSKLMRRTVIVSKKISVNNIKIDSEPIVTSTTTETSNALVLQSIIKELTTTSANTKPETVKNHESKDDSLKRAMRKLDSVFGDTAEISASTSIDIVNQINEHTVTTTEGSTSMQTNKAIETSIMLDTSNQLQLVKDEPEFRRDNTNIRRKSKLELELKDPPKAISLQTSLQKLDSIDKQIFCDHLVYSTTEDIERHVRDLLNLSVLQPIMKKLLNADSLISIMDTDNRLPKIESSKSSCDALKASFLGVRRVSDHTVLVKWNLPREVSEVQGYELLVDGRAVQKILGPSKCMAVVTCLPHAEHVLLTVRTLTAAVPRTGHFPAASIIYHPRHK